MYVCVWCVYVHICNLNYRQLAIQCNHRISHNNKNQSFFTFIFGAVGLTCDECLFVCTDKHSFTFIHVCVCVSTLILVRTVWRARAKRATSAMTITTITITKTKTTPLTKNQRNKFLIRIKRRSGSHRRSRRHSAVAVTVAVTDDNWLTLQLPQSQSLSQSTPLLRWAI